MNDMYNHQHNPFFDNWDYQYFASLFSVENNGLIVEIDYHIHRAPKIIMTLSFIVEPNRLFGQGGITNGEHGGQPSQSQTLSFNVYFYK